MSYDKNNELLNEFREADELLREAQSSLRAESDSETLTLVSDHLRKWEKTLHDTLEELEKEMKAGSESTFVQATPHGSPKERIQDHLPAPEEAPELVNWSLKRHEELAEWCESLADQAINSRTADVFRTLADELRGINRQLAADTRSLVQES